MIEQNSRRFWASSAARGMRTLPLFALPVLAACVAPASSTDGQRHHCCRRQPRHAGQGSVEGDQGRKEARLTTYLALILATCAAMQPTPSTALENIGQVGQVSGNQHVIWVDADQTGFFDVPSGVFALANKCSGFCTSYTDYRLRYNEQTISREQVAAWIPSVCALLNKKATALSFSKGSGPRNRKASFSCK